MGKETYGQIASCEDGYVCACLWIYMSNVLENSVVVLYIRLHDCVRVYAARSGASS